MNRVKFKECEEVRDRFSSLLEQGLNPSEEKVMREHLSSCPECQREYEQFDKTVHWLHSVGEEELPDGFLRGIYEKMEDRKSKASASEKVGSRWFHSPLSFGIPIQAVTMVTIIFLVFYITKIIPVETPRLKETGQTKTFLSGEKKVGGVGIPNDMKKEGMTAKPSLETSRVNDVGRTKEIVPREKKGEELLIPPHPPSESIKKEKGVTVKGGAFSDAKPPQEIVLKISDLKQGLSQLHELIKQLGGEIVMVEGNILLASLPVASYAEFEKKLEGMNFPAKEDKVVRKRGYSKSLNMTPGGMSKEVREKSKESANPTDDRENNIAIRIILLRE